MQHNTKEILKKLKVGQNLHPFPNTSYYGSDIKLQNYLEIYSVLSDLIYTYAPANSTYQRNFLDIYRNRKFDSLDNLYDEIHQFLGILRGLYIAYENDLLESIEGSIRSDVFQDFLEMAEFFLAQGDQYKHPAAFLIGGVLEEHLRKLAVQNEIEILKENGKYRHAEDLNIDLRKKGIYDDNERKSITTWLGLRNDADHAHWDSYSIEKVEVMLKDVRRIVNQYPA